ncbi:hypothetical protein SELMODRAFT_440255 [Selaginella moellendorffii]|uniref:Uncharacterized protein SF21-2 n=1 Tax=Selaginella moellendorffii TaxID=88036 RepID=D8RAI8_SELML|nr:protein NDL2 [Selaginella moellendorffii]XP_024526646.1 protein NDL2 [Selaginella moellendorffii]EFJ30331.1 hypothetical protein SELMODRAFT_440255 [Selaginella moellendorffii]|eukprot:XP_002968077.1 protein NDL2 [Selaginella moellendorffii]
MSDSSSGSASCSSDSISGGSTDSICLDLGMVPWGGQSHLVSTSYGPISVIVCGDQDKPGLLTYPDLALDTASCFDGFFSCPETSSLVFHNFCIYHIEAPGHEVGAPAVPSNARLLSVDDLADQVAEVCDYFALQEVICLGVAAGAYILSLFAMKYRERVLGLVLVSPICRAPSWSEWLYDKAVINLLYFMGMCSFVRDSLLERYLSPDTLASGESGALARYQKVLDDRQSRNVMHFWQSLHRRKDLTAGLMNLKCRTLVFVGEHSPFYNEAVYVNSQMPSTSTALVAVQEAGTLVTEEQPLSMLVPMEYFLKSFGFGKPPSTSQNSSPPTSPLSLLPCISPELLSPESLGLKLKPIKTKAPVDD